MQRDNKQSITIALLVIILIFITYQNRFYKNEFQKTNAQLHSFQNDLYSQYRDLQDHIPRQMETLLNEKINRVAEYDLGIKSIHASEKMVELAIDFTVKNLSPNAQVFILYKAEKEKNWGEIQADKNGLLSFQAELSLSLEHNYQFKFVEKTSDGGIADLNTLPIIKNIYSEFYENRTWRSSGGSGESRDEFSFDFQIENNTFGLEEYKVKSVEYKLFYKETLIYDEDITALMITESSENRPIPFTGSRRGNSASADMESQGEVRDPKIENIESMYFQITLEKAELMEKYLGLFELEDGFLKSRDNSNFFRDEIIITYDSGETMEI